MKINMYKAVATLALVFTTTALTFAVGTPIPFTFKAGDPAVAEDVNRNFQALADYINALQIKAEPFSQPDDVTTVSVVEDKGAGTVLFIDDSGNPVGVLESIYPSFDPDVAMVYGVRTFGSIGEDAPSGYVDTVTSYPTIARTETNKTWQKTTVSGHSVIYGMIYNSTPGTWGLSSRGQCRYEIKLDEMTYVQFTAFSEVRRMRTDGPWSVEQIKEHRARCKTYVKYLGVQDVPQ